MIGGEPRGEDIYTHTYSTVGSPSSRNFTTLKIQEFTDDRVDFEINEQ
jgi:hypothetical protein